MKAARKQYIQDLYRHFNYYPTWLPGVPLKLGDIGIIRKNEFTKISSLKNEGISFEVIEDDSKMDLDFVSEGGVSVTTKIAGGAKLPNSSLAEIDTGFSIEFKGENATLFKLAGTISPHISDTIKLGKEIVKRYKNGDWNKDWVIITEVVQADSSTILVSNSNDSKIELKANAEIGTANLEITDASAEFSIAFNKDVSLKFITQQNLTPLFKVMGVKGTWPFKPQFSSKGLRGIDFMSPKKVKDVELVEILPELED